jgi:tryptophan 2,3-dioxygenase
MKALRAWRRKHIAVVSKYIVQPARREAERAALPAISRSDSPVEGVEGALQGTGGTALIPFLRQAAEETLDV